MTKAQVQSILGAPDSTSAQANVEYMTYYLELPDHVDAYVRDQPYLIRMANSKVESYGRFAELLDLYNRPVTAALPGRPDSPQPVFNLGRSVLAPPTAVTTASRGTRFNLAAELETLRALRDQGVLTDEEFQNARARLLPQL